MNSNIGQAIEGLRDRVSEAYSAVETKGGILPDVQNTANLKTAILSIPSGGGAAMNYGIRFTVPNVDDLWYIYEEQEEDGEFVNTTYTAIDKFILSVKGSCKLMCYYTYPSQMGASDETFEIVDYNCTNKSLYGSHIGTTVQETAEQWPTIYGASSFYVLALSDECLITYDSSLVRIDTGTTLSGKIEDAEIDTGFTAAVLHLYGENVDLKGNSMTITNLMTMPYRDSLVGVDVSSGITEIGDQAFSDCSQLTAVTIPNTVTSIKIFAFSNCGNLSSINFPDSITDVENYAFYNCYQLATAIYNKNIFAFLPKNYFGEYIIPEGIKTIAGNAFYYRQGLTSVTIPSSVTFIGDYVFSGCTAMRSITCEAINPPVLAGYAIDGLSMSIRVNVPAGKISEYQSAPGWSRFTNYHEIEPES